MAFVNAYMAYTVFEIVYFRLIGNYLDREIHIIVLSIKQYRIN